MAKRHLRHNFILGVLNGAVFRLGTAFVHPTTVLPVFLKQFTASNVLVGFGSALRLIGWYLPQLMIAGYLEGLRYKKRAYLIANAGRLLFFGASVGILARYGESAPSVALMGFLILFAISSLFGGCAGLPFGDMVGKTIPMAHRGSFYATRFFFGSGLAILAGFTVRYVLQHQTKHPFPANFVLLFSLAIGFMGISIAFYSFVREPPSEINGPRRTFVGILREIPVLLRIDVNYRATWLSRILLAGQGLAGPFYVVLARERFGLPSHIVGLFLSVQTFGGMVSNLGWGALSRRCGNRTVIQVSSVGHVLAPLCALGMALLLPETETDWATGGAVFIFLLIGSTMSGNAIGYQSFLLDIAPEDRRPTYLGIMNTTMGLASLLPTLGGVLADVVGLEGVFLASAAMTCAGALTTRGLRSPGS